MACLSRVSTVEGRVYVPSQLENTINYIRNNRIKHGLPYSHELQDIIDEMCVDFFDP